MYLFRRCISRPACEITKKHHTWCKGRVMHSNWPVPFKTHLSLTRHHYPPTKPLHTTHILHHSEIEQDLACIVDLTFDLMLLPLWPPTWSSFLLCQTQLYFFSAPSCVVWRSRPMTRSSSWLRAPLSPSRAPAQKTQRGSSRGTMCRTSKRNKFKTMVKTTKLCKAASHPVFWPCGTWAGHTRECISAPTYTLEKLRRWLFLSQVRPFFIQFILRVIYQRHM